MNDAAPSAAGNSADQPGKTRTWWHPLLARLLDHVAATAYTVSEEVPVGKLPLRVDLLLIRRETGSLSEAARGEPGALLPLLNHFTVIQFKGPTDALERGDLLYTLGCTRLWHSQQVERIAQRDISVVILAPTVNKPARDELELLDCEAIAHEEGIFRVSGLPLKAWLVESDVMARRGEPILSLVSRVFLNDQRRIIQELTLSGHEGLLFYALQQVQQFRNLGEGFAMQHQDSQYLGEVEEELLTSVLEKVPEELLTSVLEKVPAEKRLRGLSPEERLRGLPSEDRLRGLPPDEVLRSLTPEQVAAGLSAEQVARLRDLLNHRESH